jgi:hypothetical protein
MAFIAPASQAQTARSGFEDGTITPYFAEVSTGNTAEVITPSFGARAGSKVHHLVWKQANYDGTRATRSTEGKSSEAAGLRITQEGWYGFSFYLPANFDLTKNQIIAQMHCWDNTLPTTDKTFALSIWNGQLLAETFLGFGGAVQGSAEGVVQSVPTKGVWHDVVIYVKYAKNNTGIMRLWYDGAPQASPTVQLTGINFGNGAWVNDTQLLDGSYQKWGLYAWDAANHTVGETREIYFDEVSYNIGNPSNGFDLVKPTGYGGGGGGGGPTTLYADDFSGMTAGQSPTGWTISAQSNTTCTIQVLSAPSDKGIRFTDTATNKLATASKTFTAQAGSVTAEWAFKQQAQSNWQRMWLQSGSTTAVEIYPTNILSQNSQSIPYSLVYRNASAQDVIIQNISAGTWYDVKVVANSSTDTAAIYVNGVLMVAAAPFRTAVSSINTLHFGTGNGTTGTIDFDDVTITVP